MVVNEQQAVSKYLWLSNTLSNENLMRALLMAEQIQLNWVGYKAPNKETNKILETCLDRGRILLLEESTYEEWSNQVRSLKEDFLTWSIFFAQAMCKAFAQKQVDVEWHDAGHRISFAWDNGAGVFPSELFPQGEVVLALNPLGVKVYNEIDEHLKINKYYGATEYEADFASSSAPIYTQSKLLLDCSLRYFSENSEPYTRLGILTDSPNQVKWIIGTISAGVEYDCTYPDTSAAVIDAMLGKPSIPYKISDIPIDRFLDICDSLSTSREAFGAQVAKWTDDIASIPAGEERTQKLAKLRRDEIIPAMREFNGQSHKAMRPLLESIAGGQYANLALGAFAAASAYLVGGSFETIAATGIGGAVAGAVGSIGKHYLSNYYERGRSWMALASALTDELDSWNPKELSSPPQIKQLSS
jgi:hypothetical protein